MVIQFSINQECLKLRKYGGTKQIYSYERPYFTLDFEFPSDDEGSDFTNWSRSDESVEDRNEILII